jgi:uncharacterized damage-inducible protein DinB
VRETYLFDNLDKSRTRLLKYLEQCPADKRNVIPTGFNNSIQWHLGHILTVIDRIVYTFTDQPKKLPDTYQKLFGSGTKPSEWTEEPPAWETLLSQLQEQSAQIRADFTGKLGQSVKENFFKAETMDEVLHSCIVHEAGHVGNIASMLKILV